MPTYLSLAPHSAVADHAIRLLVKESAQRDVTFTPAPDGSTPDLRLAITPGPAQGYTISQEPGQPLTIHGHDTNGLLYGIGKFLHTSTWHPYAPSTWRGSSSPDTTWRGVYIAHNFENWNTVSPEQELIDYLAELALWGVNTLAFNFGYKALANQPGRVQRYRRVLQAAHDLGFRAGLLICANCDCPPAPPQALATQFPDAAPARRGWSPDFVCPSHPDGYAHLTAWYDTFLGHFADLPVAFVVSFPYDAGGCGCDTCWPWGPRGYYTICRQLAATARRYFPASKFILGTWCFDVRDESDGEYEGLDQAIRNDPEPYVDALMADAHGSFPLWPLQHGTPGNLPTINFAEISMWGRYPWGGSGANPYPQRLQDLWQQAAHILDGGLPYSEGRFEDINKHICAGLYWQKDATATDLVQAYASWYYSADTADTVTQAIALLETNYPDDHLDPARAAKARSLLEQVDTMLPPSIRTSWRWRILLLRAIIDDETAVSPDLITNVRDAAYQELTHLYCAHTAGNPVSPRSSTYYARQDVTIKGPTFAPHIGQNASNPKDIT